ncbi:MAG TPA: Holliday junction resolvase RuvX [Chthoniobacterales bacterium]|nr:Holliday junction resolvase RuvX [Chthoniobacterales bacterium]
MNERWLGIDYGDLRIGLALSDELALLAHPTATLSNDESAIAAIRRLVVERKVTGIVVGVPRNMNGTFGPSADKAKKFGESIRKQLPDQRVVFWDERLTTAEAQRLLHGAGRNVKSSRPVLDQVAAQILLQSYLDSLRLMRPEAESQ